MRASDSDSVGNQVIRQLQEGGFRGRIFPVNPRYDEVEGMECFQSLAVAGAVDLAVLALSNDQLERSMQDAIDNRARSVAIFASCFGEASDGQPLTTRLAALARQAGIPICGGNGMGFVNLDRQLRVTGFYQPFDLMAGGVTFLTHSGSLFSAMLHNQRNIRFNLVVSDGQRIDHPHGRLHLLLVELRDDRSHRSLPRDSSRHGRHVERAGGRSDPRCAGGRSEGREDGPIARGGHDSFGRSCR